MTTLNLVYGAFAVAIVIWVATLVMSCAALGNARSHIDIKLRRAMILSTIAVVISLCGSLFLSIRIGHQTKTMLKTVGRPIETKVSGWVLDTRYIFATALPLHLVGLAYVLRTRSKLRTKEVRSGRYSELLTRL